jgi:protein SCO1/2
LRQLLVRRAFQAITGVILGLALVTWFLRGPRTPGSEDPTSHLLAEPLVAPEFTLLSHRGEPVSSTGFPGKHLMVFFGYTSCPDVCPLTLSHLSRTFQELADASEKVQVLFVTVDPARDTPARMERYLTPFHPAFLGLTGSEEEIRNVADGFGVFFARTGKDEESYTVDHTARVFVVDPEGRIPATFPLSASPEEMARDLTQLLEEAR